MVFDTHEVMLLTIVLDDCFKLSFGGQNIFLFADDGDHFLVLVGAAWENDTGTGLIANLFNRCTIFADQKFVMLRFGTNFGGKRRLLSFIAQFNQLYLGMGENCDFLCLETLMSG